MLVVGGIVLFVILMIGSGIFGGIALGIISTNFIRHTRLDAFVCAALAISSFVLGYFILVGLL